MNDKIKKSAGAHDHFLSREVMVNVEDGCHSHIFLVNGVFYWTEYGGCHLHSLESPDADVTSSEISAHRHVVRLDNATTLTEMDGEHSHGMLSEMTTYDGMHKHELVLSDGEVVESLSAGEFHALWNEMVAGTELSVDVPVAMSLQKNLDSEEAKQIAYGVVLDPYIIDAHQDWVPPWEVESACHGWMKSSQTLGKQHSMLDDGANLVESFLVPYPTHEDYQKAMANENHAIFKMPYGDQAVHSGTWIIGVQFDAERWQEIQEGEVTGFSIGGFGRKKSAKKVDMPTVTIVDLTK